jgi:hypothetical protein
MNEREPGWFPLIGGSATPTRFLSFRGDVTFEEFLHATLEDIGDKVTPTG